MELSFIFWNKGGCNAVYEGHVYTFDGHVYTFDGHVYTFDGHVYTFDGHVYTFDGHVYTFDRKKDSGVMYWQCKGNGLSNARPNYIVDAWEELKPAILHYS